MNLPFLDTPATIAAIVYAMTCLPLAWAHVTLARSRIERLVIWTAALIVGAALILLAREVYALVLELTRAGAGGDRSWLLKLGLAGLVAISLCAPVGLFAARLLRRRRA